jgi:hypothetical protein
MSNALLGIVVLLFLGVLFFRRKEGFMDSDVMSIQTDVTQQKAVLDKHLNAMNMLMKTDPEQDPNDTFDLQPTIKRIILKLQALDVDKKETDIPLVEKLQSLRKKMESVPPLIEKYRSEVNKFSDVSINEHMTVKQFLPNAQKFMEGLKADLAKILKD